jgi:hypothetical protein
MLSGKILKRDLKISCADLASTDGS